MSFASRGVQYRKPCFAFFSLQAELLGKLEDFFPKHLYPNSDRHLILGPSIADEIRDFAFKNGFDLIVVGSHGRGVAGRLFLGSTAQKVKFYSDSRPAIMTICQASRGGVVETSPGD